MENKDIEFRIDYRNSFIYSNEKGVWLVLVVLLSNLSDQPHEVRYEFLPSGELYEKIITPAPEIPKNGKIFPLPPKTVEATKTSDTFFLTLTLFDKKSITH